MNEKRIKVSVTALPTTEAMLAPASMVNVARVQHGAEALVVYLFAVPLDATALPTIKDKVAAAKDGETIAHDLDLTPVCKFAATPSALQDIIATLQSGLDNWAATKKLDEFPDAH